jgi:5-deoxy-glucuronate isomerase
MAQHYKANGFQGKQKIVTPENSDLQFLSFAMLKSSENERMEYKTADEESVLIITKGSLTFSLEGKPFAELKRKNVFDEPPLAVYLPPYCQYEVNFTEPSELCIVSCKTQGGSEARFIESKDMLFQRQGKETFYSNTTHIITEDFPASRVLVGETINDPGNWSGYPPHRHNRDNPPEEIAMEEVQYFKISPESGFGIIRIYDDSEDNLFLIKNDEVVTIPKGYHPVAAAPENQVYYLWALAGNTRKLRPSVHPDYKEKNK